MSGPAEVKTGKKNRAIGEQAGLKKTSSTKGQDDNA